MLLAGLQESPELHEAELACGPAGEVLSMLGAVTNDDRYRAVLKRLAVETR